MVCADRLIGAEVRIGNADPSRNASAPSMNALCGTVNSTQISAVRIEIACPMGLNGDWLVVHKPAIPSVLHLVEVEAYGGEFLQQLWSIMRDGMDAAVAM
jgi:hypothetical protein